MSGAESRERAEAAFGHLQHAAQELIAAAHDTLDLCEQVVSSADLHGVIDGFSHLSHLGHSVFNNAGFKWPRPGSGPTRARSGHSTPDGPTTEQAPSDEHRDPRAKEGGRPRGPVQRISVV